MKIGKVILVLVVVGAAGGGGWWWWNNRQKQKDQPTYEQVTVQRGDVTVNIQATASITPENRVEIKPPVGGRMEEVLIEEGVDVKKGQILAWMSTTDRAALIDAARARGPQEYARWQEIYKATPILAPLDGSIILRKVEPGQTVSSADAVLVLSDHLIAEAQVDETDLAQIHLGQAVKVILDAYPDRKLEGKVTHISYESKTVLNVTTYTIEITLKEIPPFVRSGMTAAANFFVAERTNVLYVTCDALRCDGDRSIVLVPAAEEGQPPEPRTVKTGLEDGKRIELTSGVSEKETVLILHAPSTNNGQTNPFMPKFPPRKRHG
ncbi:MAG: efflux RND transporter periplasmic adaptor subunit [Kiritimatiellaeota bacterium]|nr:efflux RND transporter periplasmic adaptor subunit [Kiritimatiellota bacterium]